MKLYEFFTKGLVKENIIFGMVLGLCPTLATTTSAKNGFFMGVAMVVVMVVSNFIISMIRHQVPSKVRIPVYIVIIAAFTTIIQLLMNAYTPAIAKQLGIYIPLIVANCVPLVSAESSAAKYPPLPSVLAGAGTGCGVILAFVVLGGVREFLGHGTFFTLQILPENMKMFMIFVMPPGAFICLGFLVAGFAKVRDRIYPKKAA